MTSATITRAHHPLDGQCLRVLGKMRRHGRLELLLVLPDGSKSLIPAAWTDQEDSPTESVTHTLGSLDDLLAAHALVTDLSTRTTDPIDQGQAAQQSPCKEDHRAACPAQSDPTPDPRATGHPDRRGSRTADRRGDRAAGRSDRQGRLSGSEGGRR